MIWGATDKTSTSEWDAWFAWRPVRLNDGRRAWLHQIWRRRIVVCGHRWWEYMALLKEAA